MGTQKDTRVGSTFPLKFAMPQMHRYSKKYPHPCAELVVIVVVGTQKDTHILLERLLPTSIVGTQKDTLILLERLLPTSIVGTQKDTPVRAI